jgi:hypothetical protein
MTHIPSPKPRLFGKRRSAFQVCGSVGMLFASALAMVLAVNLSLSPWVIVEIISVAIAVFLALVLATKIFTGEERIVYYHHEIGIMMATALFLVATGQPLLRYLDVSALGIGMFLACGRIGCLLVGCCHGRPYRWGVRYRAEHAAAGFPFYLVGVRLLPVQAFESLWVLFVVAGGAAMVWRGNPPGSALAWYVIAYDLGRFCFELVRGDAERPYWHGFSQPQWISLILTLGVVVAELLGYLPFHAWHVGAAVLTAFLMSAVSAWRRFGDPRRFRLMHPVHVREIARQRISLLNGPGIPAEIRVARTSLGVQFSGGEIQSAGRRIRHYAFSFPGEPHEAQAARMMAQLLIRLEGSPEPAGARPKLLSGNGGVFHLLIDAGKAD